MEDFVFQRKEDKQELNTTIFKLILDGIKPGKRGKVYQEKHMTLEEQASSLDTKAIASLLQLKDSHVEIIKKQSEEIEDLKSQLSWFIPYPKIKLTFEPQVWVDMDETGIEKSGVYSNT